jgi:adenylate kinase family enzyme
VRGLCLLSGPPGAGKTTIAGRLASSSDSGVHIHADNFWHYIVSGYIAPWLHGSDVQNEVVINAIAASALEYARAHYFVVVDGVIGPWLLNPFLMRAARTGMEIDYVVLRPSEEVTLERATNRLNGLSERWPVRKMYRAFAELGSLEANVIDSSAMSIEETVAAVIGRVLSGRVRLG